MLYKLFKRLSKFVWDKPKGLIIFKLGDSVTKWIPPRDHQTTLAEMFQKLEISNEYDALIYHYAMDVSLINGSYIVTELPDKLVGSFKDENTSAIESILVISKDKNPKITLIKKE